MKNRGMSRVLPRRGTIITKGETIMAESTCVKCGSHTFEAKEREVSDSKFTYLFIQCISCGGVVGVLDRLNIGKALHQIYQKD
jgi:hypothetical protein